MHSIKLDSLLYLPDGKKLSMSGVDNKKNINIIKGAIMNRLWVVFLLTVSITFAVKPIPRTGDENKNDKPEIKIPAQKDEVDDVDKNANNEITKNDKKDKNQNKDKTQISKDDKIVDVDSNNVNDQRENDLLKIKQLKSKFLQDLIKKIPGNDDDNNERKKPSKPVTPPKKKTR